MSEIAEEKGKCIYNFDRDCQWSPQRVVAFYTLAGNVWECLILLFIMEHVVNILNWIFANLIGEKWYPCIVLTYIFPVLSEAKHLFIWVRTIIFILLWTVCECILLIFLLLCWYFFFTISSWKLYFHSWTFILRNWPKSSLYVCSFNPERKPGSWVLPSHLKNEKIKVQNS